MDSSFLSIHAVRVFVRDLDRSIHFYVDQLGFRLAIDTRLQSGERWVAVSPPDGTAVIALVAPDPESEEYKLIGRPTEIVFVTEDVTAKFHEWRSRGVRFRFTPRLRRVKYDQRTTAQPASYQAIIEQTPVWGGVFTRFEDIDRNSFALVSFDAVSRAVEEQRRAAEAKLEADRRVAQELAIATQFQAKLFPQALPVLTTLDYAGTCAQARSVGGDYYDFLDLGQERLGLVVADVAGKGMPAALLMSGLQAAVRASASSSPRDLCERVRRVVVSSLSGGRFVTFFYATIDTAAMRLRWCNAGHNAPILARADGSVERLSAGGPTFCRLFRDDPHQEETIVLAPGDRLVLFTDGASEARRGEEEFGEDRLAAFIAAHRGESAAVLQEGIVEELTAFTSGNFSDDVTLVVVAAI
jgi:serine phosphatase RsbU (regulator of sigma subunit)